MTQHVDCFIIAKLSMSSAAADKAATAAIVDKQQTRKKKRKCEKRHEKLVQLHRIVSIAVGIQHFTRLRIVNDVPSVGHIRSKRKHTAQAHSTEATRTRRRRRQSKRRWWIFQVENEKIAARNLDLPISFRRWRRRRRWRRIVKWRAKAT